MIDAKKADGQMVGTAAERIGRGGASGWLHAEDSRTKVGIIFELYVGFF